MGGAYEHLLRRGVPPTGYPGSNYPGISSTQSPMLGSAPNGAPVPQPRFDIQGYPTLRPQFFPQQNYFQHPFRTEIANVSPPGVTGQAIPGAPITESPLPIPPPPPPPSNNVPGRRAGDEGRGAR